MWLDDLIEKELAKIDPFWYKRNQEERKQILEIFKRYIMNYFSLIESIKRMDPLHFPDRYETLAIRGINPNYFAPIDELRTNPHLPPRKLPKFLGQLYIGDFYYF